MEVIFVELDSGFLSLLFVMVLLADEAFFTSFCASKTLGSNISDIDLCDIEVSFAFCYLCFCNSIY